MANTMIFNYFSRWPNPVVFGLVLLTVIKIETPCSAQSVSELLTAKAEISRVDYSRIGVRNIRGHLHAKGNAPAFIGSSENRTEFFAGAIDELRIYRQAIGKEGIAQLHRGDLAVENKQLTAWFRLDGETGNHAAVGAGRNAKSTVGTLEFVNGKSGKALWLNGKNQTLRIDPYPELKPSTNQISISAWPIGSLAIDCRKKGADTRQIFLVT